VQEHVLALWRWHLPLRTPNNMSFFFSLFFFGLTLRGSRRVLGVGVSGTPVDEFRGGSESDTPHHARLKGWG
jgi:hypothetical protein